MTAKRNETAVKQSGVATPLTKIALEALDALPDSEIEERTAWGRKLMDSLVRISDAICKLPTGKSARDWKEWENRVAAASGRYWRRFAALYHKAAKR